MPKNTTYTVKEYVPDGKGGLRDLKDLSPEEYEGFCQKLTDKLAEQVTKTFERRPEFFKYCCDKKIAAGIRR